jgi:hypothetical protein
MSKQKGLLAIRGSLRKAPCEEGVEPVLQAGDALQLPGGHRIATQLCLHCEKLGAQILAVHETHVLRDG